MPLALISTYYIITLNVTGPSRGSDPSRHNHNHQATKKPPGSPQENHYQVPMVYEKTIADTPAPPPTTSTATDDHPPHRNSNGAIERRLA